MLRVCNLTMRYPNGKLALAGFDLTVKAGELVVVLGGNGSGKTTLLRCVTRTLDPTARRDLARRHRPRRALAASGCARRGCRWRWSGSRPIWCGGAASSPMSPRGALGRHGGWWTALGRPAGRGAARRAYGHLDEVGLAAARRAARRHPVGRPGAARRDRPGAGAAAARAARRRTGGEPRSRGRRRDHAPACAGSPPRKTSPCCACCIRSSSPIDFADRVVGIRDGRIVFDLPCGELPRDAVRQLYLSEAA